MVTSRMKLSNILQGLGMWVQNVADDNIVVQDQFPEAQQYERAIFAGNSADIGEDW